MAKEQFHIAGRNDGRLYRAIVNGDRKTVTEELRIGDIDPNLSINGKTILHHAGERGFKEIARQLIAYGADANSIYGKQHRSLLHFAAATGNYGFASVLLECGARPSPRTRNNSTPLHFAARTGQGYLVDRLIKASADIMAEDNNGKTAFQWALKKGFNKVARQIVEASDTTVATRFMKELKVAEIESLAL